MGRVASSRIQRYPVEILLLFAGLEQGWQGKQGRAVQHAFEEGEANIGTGRVKFT